MTLLILLASILIAGVSVLQYKEEAEEYHKERLVRKEEAIKKSIDYMLKYTTYEIATEKIPLIFKEKIFELSEIHNLPIKIYDLEGNLLIKSKGTFFNNEKAIPKKIIYELESLFNKRYIMKYERDGKKFQTSYTYISDRKAKPLAILNLPYLEDDDFITRELNEFLRRLAEIYLLMLLMAIAMAYFLSKYITRSLKTISEKIDQTRLDKKNKRIELERR